MNLKTTGSICESSRNKSFSEAAKQLFLTQPTISAHVSALEKRTEYLFPYKKYKRS